MTAIISVDRPESGVAVVTLNRPQKYNALSMELLARLGETLDSLAGGPLRALVLTGADPAFCAGLDLDELGAGANFGPDSIRALREFPRPVIGAINGVAVTGGLEVALACDFRIASDRARFADTHSRVGVVPGWGLTARLPQAVGQSWARQMSFTGDYVDAQTALRIGLVNQVVAHDQLLATALGLAASIASTNEQTQQKVRGIYDLVRDGTGGAGLAAELEAGEELRLAAPEDFAARKEALFERSRNQG